MRRLTLQGVSPSKTIIIAQSTNVISGLFVTEARSRSAETDVTYKVRLRRFVRVRLFVQHLSLHAWSGGAPTYDSGPTRIRPFYAETHTRSTLGRLLAPKGIGWTLPASLRGEALSASHRARANKPLVGSKSVQPAPGL